MADADLLQVGAARQGEGQAEVDRATAHRLGIAWEPSRVTPTVMSG